MSQQEETVNVSSGLNVSSIQITINLGKPAGAVEPHQLIPPPTDAPQGTFVRQAFSIPGSNNMKVRLTFIPDDQTQNLSIQVMNEDPGEKAKWLELLNDDPAIADLDAGVVMLRLNANNGQAIWLPYNVNQNPISRLFNQKTPLEPGGVSIGDFTDCWAANGRNAAAAAHCLSQL